METAFSRGGWFWPDDHFPQANPLLLHFDVEARLEAGVEGERYRIVITLPIRPPGGRIR